jgi:cytochrome c oxidase subunit II
VIQGVVWSVSIILMGCLAILFIWVATGANVAIANYGPVIDAAYRMRVWLFALALIVLIGTNYKTIGELPYINTLPPLPAAEVQPTQVVAEQWDWAITPHTFKVGQTAEFHVTSKDVNHGFALYDPEFRIVAETQAMPGYTNVLRYTFTEPGTYQVLCLEYCGLAHHLMKTEITVAEH